MMILPKERDQRLITIRRGGTLSDDDHRLLALWAAACAGHVLEYFEQAQPNDHRPHHALAQLQAWVRGELSMSEARAAGGHANAAARGLSGAARFAGFAAAQAALVAHVAAHNLGAAAYAIKAVCAAATKGTEDEAGRQECAWQHAQLPATLRAFVLEDQRARNPICWGVFAVND